MGKTTWTSQKMEKKSIWQNAACPHHKNSQKPRCGKQIHPIMDEKSLVNITFYGEGLDAFPLLSLM